MSMFPVESTYFEQFPLFFLIQCHIFVFFLQL